MARTVTIEDPPDIVLGHLPPDIEVVTLMPLELSNDEVRAIIANTTTRIITLPADTETADLIAASIGDAGKSADTPLTRCSERERRRRRPAAGPPARARRSAAAVEMGEPRRAPAITGRSPGPSPADSQSSRLPNRLEVSWICSWNVQKINPRLSK